MNPVKKSDFNPVEIYKQIPGTDPVKHFISPGQYIQGPGIIARTGSFIRTVTTDTACILITPGRNKNIGDQIRSTLSIAGLDSETAIFQGEATLSEVCRIRDSFMASNKTLGCLIGVGGGKCLDSGRMAADRLNIPFISLPTTAATDAPTAAHSVIYDADGVFSDVEFHKTNPCMVIVDTDIISRAPLRYLVSGMGDALATWYEAACCAGNPRATLVRGGRPTAAALAIAHQCREVLFKQGAAAVDALAAGQRNDTVEQVIEANILLSGLGFESGGLAGSHAVAQALTEAHRLHQSCLHGELVAIGVMTQLMLEKNSSEAEPVAAFLSSVGLPVSLIQLGFNPADEALLLDKIANRALEIAFLYNEPFDITVDSITHALIEAANFGKIKMDQLDQSRFNAIRKQAGG